MAKKAGWDGISKTEKDRKFLSDLKDLCTDYNDMPLNDMKAYIEKCRDLQRGDAVVFLMIREPHEIERAKQAFDATTLLITRFQVESIESNHADANVGRYDYDYIITNDKTIDDLKVKAKRFIEFITEIE